eukprot:gnl/MRDRNA2_/MRDRNA2_36326_c0_seq1.p1 gnl/MRDRNA2_/MRDRNA2_36326_c0~~gnl/MRDRNA2_/MRDRNA2_36326_c0_seq1.p1  ORF type:complete len:196 (-),score=23.45 gnl/MRDRNA2_/MRDRNA2_36326_c0_seq1:223-810(-)
MSEFMFLWSLLSVASAYTSDDATAFVGAQHWWESGWYSDTGLQKHYDGFFCLCSCASTEEGIFCKGGGVHPDLSVVAQFLGVFSVDTQSKWTGTLVAFNTTTPFTDTFSLIVPGGPANYTGASHISPDSNLPRSFVWRGYMDGVRCEHRSSCRGFCAAQKAPVMGSSNFAEWDQECNQTLKTKQGNLRGSEPIFA